MASQGLEDKDTAYRLGGILQLYVVGMSIPKLDSHLKEYKDVKKSDWSGFYEFLEGSVSEANFNPKPKPMLWSAWDKRNFARLLEKWKQEPGPNLNEKIERGQFDHGVALVFHHLLAKIIVYILQQRNAMNVQSPHAERLAPSMPFQRQSCFRPGFRRLHWALGNLTVLLELPSAMKLYTGSVTPTFRSTQNASRSRDSTYQPHPSDSRSGDEDSTADDSTNDDSTDDDSTDDDSADDDSADEDSADEYKAKGASVRHISCPRKSHHGKYSEGDVLPCKAPMSVVQWRKKYLAWITGILRQWRAASHLVNLEQQIPVVRHISKLSFTPVMASKPDTEMEHWKCTIRRVLRIQDRKAFSEIKNYLSVLAENASRTSTYSWLQKWRFCGAVHCEALIACENLKNARTKSSMEPGKLTRETKSKIGVSKRCCTVCTFLLQNLRQPAGHIPPLGPVAYLGSSGKIWGCALPKECPVDLAEVVNDRLSEYLREALLASKMSLYHTAKEQSTLFSSGTPESDPGSIIETRNKRFTDRDWDEGPYEELDKKTDEGLDEGL